ncbi:ATP-dependent Clp protease ATP-binding subunit [Patescibacteria group bacterium]|nr:ATP-dependent Clp protease ATP-binding subunit [Patescibacteria group bacterium]
MNKEYEFIFNKFSTRLKEALVMSFNIAKDLHENKVYTDHVVQALYYQDGSIASEVLRKAKVRPDMFKSTAKQNKKSEPTETDVTNLGRILKFMQPKDGPVTSELTLSKTLKDTLLKTVLLAKQQQHSFVGTEHFLLVIIKNKKSRASILFKRYKIDTSFIQEQLENILESTAKFSDMTTMFSLGKKKTMDSQSALKEYCDDLTTKKAVVSIDPVIGRKNEIKRIIHILGRRNKNNVLVVGEPGVGKTVLIEGLAKKIVEGDVPPILKKKKILRLDLAKIIAGTMFRGEFEGRLKSLIDAAQKNPDVIIFVDEIHSIIGLGNAQGSLDANNILKPALTSGAFQCLGTTTFDEYRKHIENDSAFERRFQMVKVEEPTPKETKEILSGIKDEYESYHQVAFTPGAVDSAIALSERYMPEKRFPDKAIDVLDEAAAHINITSFDNTLYEKIEKKRKEREAIHEKKNTMVVEENFQEALKLQAKQQQVEKELKTLQSKEKKNKKNWPQIDEEHIAEAVSAATGIPLQSMLKTEKEKLLKLEGTLKKKIVGQDEAVKTIAQFIRRAKSGLKHPNRPIGSFMFLGPTGTGKTELAKVIAKEIFEDKDALIRIDMSEFSEKFNASKLIGAPAGYIGFEEGGKLTEAVRKKPYSVVLFDEIEKAHPDIFNLLLQILDDGFITDAAGRKINFRNTIVIMTSNTGTKSIMEAAPGFKDQSDEEKTKETDYNQYKGKVQKELKDTFRPEFLNRIDRIIVYKPLSKESIKKIVTIQINELKKRLKTEKKVTLDVSKSIEDEVVKSGFNPELGARPLRKAIQEIIEDALAEEILKETISENDSVRVTKKGGSIVVEKK